MERESALDRTPQQQPASPLQPLTSAWEGRLKRANEYKHKNFDVYAQEAMDFYVGPSDMEEFYSKRMLTRRNGVDNTDLKGGFRTVSAKVAELVQLFGPSLYARNPVRTVTPRETTPLQRSAYVDPALERQIQNQVQQIQQQAQQYMQQMQSQMPPQQPGMPPDPQIQAMQQQFQQQVQAQIQQVQAPLMEAQERFLQAMDQQKKQAAIRQIKADLLSGYLNYTPNELDLKGESRLCINEALIKGMGVQWTQVIQRGNSQIVGSFYDTVDNLLMDPDVEKHSDIRWVSRRCVKTISEVASLYGTDEDKLKPFAKIHTYAAASGEDVYKSRGGDTAEPPRDLVTYYEIFSKIGFGDDIPGLDDKYEDLLESFGMNVLIVIVPGMHEPLNVSAAELDQILDVESGGQPMEGDEENSRLRDQMLMKVSWPIPFWMDGCWPMEMLWFHEIPNCVWPMSHVRPAMPQLKAITWNMNHLANRARNTSRLLIGLKEGADDDAKGILKSGDPVGVINLKGSQNEKLSEMWDILQMPQGGATELLNVQAGLIDEFQKSTGLAEVMYAQPGGMRSAAEAQMKQSSMNIRPDDMSSQVEDWQSRVASKEALALTWLFTGEDVAPIIGQAQGELWDEHLAPEDPGMIAMELDVRIESGSTRKPNKETRVQQMTQAVQVMGPVLSQLAMGAGQVGPWNALMKEWGKANDIPDIDGFLLQPPPPPQPPQPDPTEMAKAQIEMQSKQQEGQIKMALGQQQMQAGERKAQMAAAESNMKLAAKAQELQMRTQEMQMELQAKQAEIQLDIAKAQASAKASEIQHNQAIIASSQKAELDAQVAKQKSEIQIEAQKQKAQQNARNQPARRQKRKQGR